MAQETLEVQTLEEAVLTLLSESETHWSVARGGHEARGTGGRVGDGGGLPVTVCAVSPPSLWEPLLTHSLLTSQN